MKKRRFISLCLSALVVMTIVSCGQEDSRNLVKKNTPTEERVVDLFSPMEKTDPDAENVARTAADLTVAMAEEKLGVNVAYWTYTAENYQDRTYDEVALDRARNNMDDLYLLNSNVILTLVLAAPQ